MHVLFVAKGTTQIKCDAFLLNYMLSLYHVC